MSRARVRITVTGAVQGIGFRPLVYRRAGELGLTGFVRNRGTGLEIEAEGETPGRLADALREAPPPGALIERVDCAELSPLGDLDFRILPSVPEAAGPLPPRVLPDLACCADCLRDVFDPASRFHRYPFTNCSHCGPRYSIQRAVPYDRGTTTMAAFTLCAACRAEYQDPASRRFHAQPIACPACGPALEFRAAGAAQCASAAVTARHEAALEAAVALVAAGGILALKGLGGYQLVADARDPAALARLRQRKARAAKPFAIMVRDLDEARRHCRVSAAEAALLASPAAPIVLLAHRAATLPEALAPGLGTLGVMLPTTPLHHLLLRALPGPVVCTSGNRAEEPIAIDDADARERLAGIADAWLLHDRPIHRPLDDSVARVIDGGAQVLRVGRGYAPVVLDYGSDRGDPVDHPDRGARTGRNATEGRRSRGPNNRSRERLFHGSDRQVPAVLACGGHLKNTLAVTRGGRLVVSQHLGDLDDARCLDAMQRAAADLVTFNAVEPTVAAIDAHPDYASSTDGPAAQLPRRTVQHHLAHALAVMLEHDLAGPVLAVVWDGSGLGSDGTLWGGEFLRVERRGGVRWTRVGHLRPFALPGGEAAAREPDRALSGVLWQIPGLRERVPPAHRLLLEKGINAPLTSSTGRLFDAVAALVGFRGRQRYEGEAAMRLEHSVARCPAASSYPLPVQSGVVDWAPLIAAAAEDCAAGVSAACIAARFHAALAGAIVEQARRVGLDTVILTGGCFQNRQLTERAIAGLRAAGFRPVIARRLPPHDGALAAGQAVAAAEGVCC